MPWKLRVFSESTVPKSVPQGSWARGPFWIFIFWPFSLLKSYASRLVNIIHGQWKCCFNSVSRQFLTYELYANNFEKKIILGFSFYLAEVFLVEHLNFGWLWCLFTLFCRILILSQNLRLKIWIRISQIQDVGGSPFCESFS